MSARRFGGEDNKPPLSLSRLTRLKSVMSSHPPGTDNDEILVEDELESIAGGSEMSPLHTKSSAAPFLSSRASSGEPVGTETDEEDDHGTRIISESFVCLSSH